MKRLALAAVALLALSACTEDGQATPGAPADYTITGKAVYVGKPGKVGTYVSYMLFGDERELWVTIECYDGARIGTLLADECRQGEPWLPIAEEMR